MTTAPTPLQTRRMPRNYLWALAALAIGLIVGGTVGLLVGSDVFDDSSSSTGVQGSGVAATETRDLPPFSSVELAGSNIVTIRVGKEQSVVVRADNNLVDRVTTAVQDGSLVIGDIPGSYTTKSPMSVTVSVPSLDALTLTGSGLIAVSDIEASSLTVSLPGSGVLRASGAATELDVTLGGSGDAQLEQLITSDVRAVVSGSGRIVLTATKSLDASVSGSGAIMYSGNPQEVTKSITGSGAIVSTMG
jgi:Putative auto-transporter adhesin, head GIN domain